MAASTPYEVVVLDVMLPDLDGFGVCRELRAQDVWTPVLMLTAHRALSRARRRPLRGEVRDRSGNHVGLLLDDGFRVVGRDGED